MLNKFKNIIILLCDHENLSDLYIDQIKKICNNIIYDTDQPGLTMFFTNRPELIVTEEKLITIQSSLGMITEIQRLNNVPLFIITAYIKFNDDNTFIDLNDASNLSKVLTGYLLYNFESVETHEVVEEKKDTPYSCSNRFCDQPNIKNCNQNDYY